MKQYLEYLHRIMQQGVEKTDRTGTGTRSVFGHQMRFDLTEGFPLVTVKYTPFKLIAGELLWFLKGEQHLPGADEDLRQLSGVAGDKKSIWEEWKKEDGSFGPIYGVQWRSWPSFTYAGGRLPDGSRVICSITEIDQIANVIERIQSKPDDRRLIVSSWNVADVESGDMALPPCHVFFQFYTREMTFEQRLKAFARQLEAQDKTLAGRAWETWDEKLKIKVMDEERVPTRYLDCQLYQRSCDSFLGVPFNVASYALLTHMVAQVVNMEAGDFVWTGGDCHIYQNHFDQVEELLSRTPKPQPRLWINPGIRDIDDFKPEDLRIEDYEHCGRLEGKVAV